MEELHLIANAHIDPVWQWQWQEGATSCIATFNSAIKLLKEFDFTFCHNESILYKYIEEYAPELFKQIQKAVIDNKWHIIGGWYLQPDCLMIKGESVIRQSLMGREYFKDKFNVEPKTAINFDSFGHSRGIVQILKKTGQDNYIITRPNKTQFKYIQDDFIWKGYDESEINVLHCDAYSTPLGYAGELIEKFIKENSNKNIALKLWGLGNHGGGASRKDLNDIEKLQKNYKFKILHSIPENYFKKFKSKVIIDKSLITCMPGCYTSMSKLKRKHIKIEEEYYYVEKMASLASLSNLVEYPSLQLAQAIEAIMYTQFHDLIAGTVIKKGEDYAISLLDYADKILSEIKFKSFLALSKNQKVAKDGDYPILVYNPNPYVCTKDIEVELSIIPVCEIDEESYLQIYNEKGELCKSQRVKEDSNINLDWRKKIAFEATLKPYAINRFNIKIEYQKIKEYKIKSNIYDFNYANYSAHINEESGLIDKYIVDGVNYATGNLFELFIYNDNEDPWAMADSQLKKIGSNPQKIKLIKKANGIFANLKAISVIEDGDIYTQVESLFAINSTKVKIDYKFYKNQNYIDVNILVYWNEKNKMLKCHLPVGEGKLIGQQIFGMEELFSNNKENISQRFVALEKDKKCLAIFNNCIYGNSYDKKNIKLSLLRGTTYCAHPINNKKLMRDDLYIPVMDQGEHNFEFRITVCEKNNLEYLSNEFVNLPYALNVFPIEQTIENTFKIEVSNKNIVISAIKKSIDNKNYVIRLFNNSEEIASTKLIFNEENLDLKFTKFEVKTLIYDKKLKEIKNIVI